MFEFPRAVTRTAAAGMVSTIDHAATAVGVDLLRRGGSAADAAVGANAVLAVTSPHACGPGGDVWALVHDSSGPPVALNAAGFAGSGADAARLRARGLDRIPLRGHVSSVTVPGAVDGWLALHRRFGRLPLAEVLAEAIRMAADGFSASPHLAERASEVAGVEGNTDIAAGLRPGQIVRRPGTARALRAVIEQGRGGFYGGEFGQALLELGGGEYSPADLDTPVARWVEPVRVSAFGCDLWTVPPPSQGYLTLASAWIADGLDFGAAAAATPGGAVDFGAPPAAASVAARRLPAGGVADLAAVSASAAATPAATPGGAVGSGAPPVSADGRWAHLLVEAASMAAYDRHRVLHEGAEGRVLVHEARLAPRRAAIDPARAANVIPPSALTAPGDPAPGGAPSAPAPGGAPSDPAPAAPAPGGAPSAPAPDPGDTTYLCAVDADRMGVSLINSNASGFGAHLVAGATGIFLHDRGIGFSLEPGHPALYAPGRRPPHTLAPALVTRPDGALRMVLGAMGGDSQPQILLQLLHRILELGQSPGRAVSAGRWVLAPDDGADGFSTWLPGRGRKVLIEDPASGWAPELAALGHAVGESPPGAGFGHAHVIEVTADGALAGAADPRSLIGAAAGL